MNERPSLLELSGSFTLAIPAGRAFPLFSPLGERAWVPGWDPEIVYPVGAEWEERMIFRSSGVLRDAIWTVTHLDAESHRVSYFRVEGADLTAHVDVECRAVASNETEVFVRYTFVALSDDGRATVEAMSREEYDRKMIQWQRWISREFLVNPSVAPSKR